MGVEPGRLWKGEPLLPELLTQQHQEVFQLQFLHLRVQALVFS